MTTISADAAGQAPQRIGIIVPSANCRVEQEMIPRLPAGYVAHVTRLRMVGEHYTPLARLLPRAADFAALTDAGAMVVAFNCTASAMEDGVTGIQPQSTPGNTMKSQRLSKGFHRVFALAACCALSVALVLAPRHAEAQGAYPNKPVRIIVAYAAGGVADVMARLVATPMGTELGQSVIVENRPGAGGAIGTQACVNAVPDGYTLCMGSQSSVILNPMMVKEASYDAVKSFTPISLIAYAPNLLVVSPKLNVKTFDELIRWIRANPGAAWGTSGVGTSNHLMAVYLSRELGLKIEHAPYKGGVLAVQDALAGHLPMVMDQISSSLQHVRRGALIAVAQSGATRSIHLPNVPTFAETVLPKFRYDSFQALLGPAGLPPEVTQRLNAALRKVVAQPDIRDRLVELGGVPITNTPEEFAGQIREQVPLFRELVQLSGLTVQ